MIINACLMQTQRIIGMSERFWILHHIFSQELMHPLVGVWCCNFENDTAKIAANQLIVLHHNQENNLNVDVSMISASLRFLTLTFSWSDGDRNLQNFRCVGRQSDLKGSLTSTTNVLWLHILILDYLDNTVRCKCCVTIINGMSA